MAWKPGQSGNPAGKVPGTPTRLTKSVRDAFLAAFNALQTPDPNDQVAKNAQLTEWARQNPSLFYKLAARMIPAKVELEGGLALQVVTGVPPRGEPEPEDEEPLA